MEVLYQLSYVGKIIKTPTSPNGAPSGLSYVGKIIKTPTSPNGAPSGLSYVGIVSIWYTETSI
jgi:hypothetical protein